MNSKQLILSFIIVLFCTLASVAQNPVATLEHDGTTQVFYGQGSFVEAYNASANGDQIYLSTGFFTPPPTIEKGIKVIGAGHFPDSANVAKRTFIMSGLTIFAGADSLFLEGLYFNGGLTYDYNNRSVNYVKVFRCRITNVELYSSTLYRKNNCTFEECIIVQGINIGSNANNFCIKNSIISGIYGGEGNALITNNIILQGFSNITTSVFWNNIIMNQSSSYGRMGAGNNFTNNVFVNSSIDFGTNSSSNNYTGVNQTDFFINQTGYEIDYTHNYHLKNPELYIGTDGTQVGIYGGTTPFKEKGAPSNPQVATKQIANETDPEGNLKVDITVKAQNR